MMECTREKMLSCIEKAMGELETAKRAMTDDETVIPDYTLEVALVHAENALDIAETLVFGS